MQCRQLQRQQRGGGRCPGGTPTTVELRAGRRQPLLVAAQAGRSPEQATATTSVATASATSSSSSSSSSRGKGSSAINFPDPEAKFHRYGAHFGGIHKLNLEWLQAVPRVRVRTSDTRKLDELVELAVLNERLSGRLEPWQARQKLDYLRKRRKNWELIFEYVTKQDAAATLEVIEEASRKVEEALSEESRERTAVDDLREQLQGLQTEVLAAQARLQLTHARVDQNLHRVLELKAEAEQLERSRAEASAGASPAPTLPSGSQLGSSSNVGARSVGARSRSVRASASTTTQERPTQTSPAQQPRGSERASTSYVQDGAPGRRSSAAMQRGRGLESSLEIEDALRNYWYPTEFSSKLTKDTMVPFELMNESWVLFRDENGRPSCVRDECAHRACPLSLGRVVDGQVECAYHGWKFNGDGACTHMPSTVQCRNVGVSALPCAEQDGFVWVWPGDGLPPEVPSYTLPPAGFKIHAEIMVDVPVEHGLLMENLLDLAHAPFTHTSTFARGWPVPDFVKFHASKVLSGNWDPYPIDMAFHPPCMVESQIGLAQPGKIMRGVTASQCKNHLHQLHVCMPSKRGHTRLLYRMSLDFLPWLAHVPFIDRVWKNVANQVLGEDLVLVLGQQDRMQRGGNTWSMPVAYDKLAVRYRRWRNAVATGELAPGDAAGAHRMTAGEMFSDTEEEL